MRNKYMYMTQICQLSTFINCGLLLYFGHVYFLVGKI
uniref:Uncharacterized protein n=1 Tax=Arundo donax TaxID=35708 RepID=A0A0A9H1X6_ARUDO